MKKIFAFLVMAALVGFFSWWLGPGLANDYTARSGTLVPAQDLRISEAKCRTKLFVISFCDIKTEGASDAQKQELSYLIFGRLGGEGVSLLRSQENPAILTSTVGIDYFWNRVISFLALVGLLSLLLIGSVIAMVRTESPA